MPGTPVHTVKEKIHLFPVLLQCREEKPALNGTQVAKSYLHNNGTDMWATSKQMIQCVYTCLHMLMCVHLIFSLCTCKCKCFFFCSDIMPSCYAIFNYLCFSPTPRRFPSSLYVWRLHQTSSASFSSPSNGCFSLPAPTYGSSMSGTQVSPSFLADPVLSLPAKQPLSPPKTLCTRNF